MTLRRRVMRALRRLDRMAGRLRGRRRVLVEVRTPMNLEVLRPVWSALGADARMDLSFVAEDETGVGAVLTPEGLAGRMITASSARWTRFDLALNADPWNAIDLRRCGRRLNFFHGVAGKYDLDDPAALGRGLDLRIYHRVMFPNEDRLRRYLDAGVVHPRQAVLVGFPKADDLVNGRWSAAEVRTGLGLDPARATVLYAPTFSPESSLHLAGESIVEVLLASGWNVIVKLHDRSLVPHPRFTAGIDWPSRLARFTRQPGYAFASGPHAGPCLAAADLLVTDHSTVGFEFALLDRPIVVFDAPRLLQSARIHPERWHQLRAMADLVTSPDDLPAVVSRALASPERLAEARRRTAHALFAYQGRATHRALEVVYGQLELERPA
jgi:hypothetical protein